MVKNKSKNKKSLFKFGTMKNNKEQLLFPINISHRSSHGYIPAGAMYTNTEDLRSSRAHQQRKLPLRQPTVPPMTTKAVKPTTHSLHWNSKPVINEWNKGSVLYVAISHDNVMPWKHLRITGPL